MIKKTQLTLACSLSICLSSIAYANGDENPIQFSVIPDIPNINCNGPIINATYTVINQEENATILVTPDEIINHDDFPDNLVQIQPASAPGSLTTCDYTYLKPGKTCDVNLIITPASCANGPITGSINRTLVMITGTMYENPTAKIKSAYSTIGAGDDFAILGNEVYNNGSTSYVVGSVGHTGSGNITGPFVVSNGQLYLSATDPNVINANNAFLAAYDYFIANKANCRIRTDLSFPSELQSSYYCLTSSSGLNEVSIDGLIILSGKGNFVFFIDDDMGSCIPTATANAPCNLYIKSTTSFRYQNGASAENVYWVTGNGADIQIESGAELDGTVLSGGSISTSEQGPSPASVFGHLWSLSTITLYGDSVFISE